MTNSLNFNIPDGYTTRKIEEIGTTTYVGYSQLGQGDDTLWYIQRIIENGNNTSITYSRGAWTDRATLNYN